MFFKSMLSIFLLTPIKYNGFFHINKIRRQPIFSKDMSKKYL